MVRVAKAIFFLGLTSGLASEMVCDANGGSDSCVQKQEVTSLLQVKETVYRRGSSSGLTPAANHDDVDAKSQKLSKLCIREDVHGDGRQANVLKYMEDILGPKLFNTVDSSKYSHTDDSVPKLNTDFLNPTTCPYMVGYQHGQMNYFGVPTIHREKVARKGGGNTYVPKTDPEEIVIELIARRNKAPNQMVYLAQCSEYREYDKKAFPVWGIKPNSNEMEDRLNLWSKPCDANTVVSFLFVTPGLKSWSAYVEKGKTHTATEYTSLSKYDADNGVGIGYMVSMLNEVGGGKKPYQAASEVNKDVVKPRVDAGKDEKGVEVMCRQPRLDGTVYTALAARHKTDEGLVAAEWNLLVNAAVKSGCITGTGNGWRAKVSSSDADQVKKVADCLGDGTGNIAAAHKVTLQGS